MGANAGPPILMDYILILFTFMPPHANAFEHELPMRSMEKCEAFVSRREPSFAATDGLFYKFECREKPTPAKVKE